AAPGRRHAGGLHAVRPRAAGAAGEARRPDAAAGRRADRRGGGAAGGNDARGGDAGVPHERRVRATPLTRKVVSRESEIVVAAGHFRSRPTARRFPISEPRFPIPTEDHPMTATTLPTAAQLEHQWATDPRWAGIVRGYSAAEV